MIVDTVSPTPFALLRRAKNFEYRDSDHHLQQFSNFEDPIRALTDECLRVLRCISSTNQSSVSSSKTSTSLRDASWSRFEDIGFGGSIESDPEDEEMTPKNAESGNGLRTTPHSSGGDHLGRPTTPSWADFMSAGFSDENPLKAPPAPLLLPPDKVLPPIATDRGQSSQSHKRTLDQESPLEPGELASITTLDLDDSFWWVWVSSLAGEEPVARKAVFGRCTLVETIIRNAKWLILEEQVKGAAPEPEPGAYIVEKKRFFSFSSRKGKLTRRKSSAKKVQTMEESYKRNNNPAPQSKTSIAPDQHARIQAAAAALQRKHKEQEQEHANGSGADERNDTYSVKTNSILTLQPAIMSEASQAMKWAKYYDKTAYRAAYLNDSRAGTGAPSETLKLPSNDKPSSTMSSTPSTTTRQAPASKQEPALATPQQDTETPAEVTSKNDTDTPAQPPAEPEPKKSESPSEASPKKLKKKPGNTGIKGMFGTGRKKAEQPPMKPTGAEPSAVAAARAALEGKAKASQEPPRPGPTTNGLSASKRKPVPENPTVAPDPELEKPVTPKASEEPEPVSEPASHVQQNGNGWPEHNNGPTTQQDSEHDALSRVDTNEQVAADREFSRFDQGPLVEQPAFAPEDSPVSSESPFSEGAAGKPTSADGKSMETMSNDQTPGSPGASATQDRWAQIRKNAAERAAQSSPPGHGSMDTERTDEGDTSGEESK